MGRMISQARDLPADLPADLPVYLGQVQAVSAGGTSPSMTT